MVRAEFHGTQIETLALIAAVEHQCGGGASTKDGQQCTYNLSGARVTSCAAHRAFIDDQRFLDGVLAYRNMVERLLLEEFNLGPPRPPLEFPPREVRRARTCHCGRC